MGLATNFVGELLGTFILVFFGCGVVASATLFAAHTGMFQVAGVWGIGVTLAIPGPRGGFLTVYIVGPLLGGAAAAALFRGVFQRLMGRPRIVCTCGQDPGK